jgi:hypothetical protein
MALDLFWILPALAFVGTIVAVYELGVSVGTERERHRAFITRRLHDTLRPRNPDLEEWL